MPNPLILVADDSPDIRKFLQEAVLGPAGYQVQLAADGQSALELARQTRPDVVITDQQMPRLSGLELIRQLCASQPHPPVILMSSDRGDSLVVEAMRAGAFDFLAKPFEAELMLAAVGRALAHRRAPDGDGALSRPELPQTGSAPGPPAVQAQVDRAEPASPDASGQGLRRQLEGLKTLVLLGRAVTEQLDHHQALTEVVNAAVRLTGAEEGSLLLLDEDSGELYMRASKNFDDEFVRTFRLEVHDSLAGRVIESGQPVLIDEQTPQKIKTSYLVHSLIYVPLQVRGRTIGVLGVDNRKAGRTLTKADVAIMSAMADYAAIALENARLYSASEAERRKLETILARVENGVIVTDPEQRLLIMNQTARETMGVNGDWAGRHVKEVVEDPRLISVFSASGKFSNREEIELDDGRVFSAQRTPIEGIGQAIVMQDITKLKELDRIKSEFVTMVSHDLRSPLTAILGYIELVERSGELSPQQNEFLRRARLSVGQITDLVSNLLDLGRIEAGLDEAKEQTPLAMLARYAVEGMRAAAEAKGLSLHADLPDSLPMVWGAPIRLRQMIGNLIDNAIKYTPGGGKVTVAAKQESQQVILTVEDTGVGVPPEEQPYLFDKFYRASNAPADLQGTGLGLSIVKSIVDNHGGRVWIDSQPGEGTVFNVVLPTAEP